MPPLRGAGRRKRESSLRKPTYVPALTATPASDSDSSLSPYDAQDDPAAVPHEDPVAPLRRVNVMLQFVSAGMLALGSTLVVSLYVTGPPRLSDIDSSMTAVLLTTMVVGAAALLILLG
ncbi:hypothetical protein Rhopal_004547-T1 [Rhodotorula paludigena]|uniref:Uncharacterized protein n=1 Tax=Rhodotorula paludigena TaxID=86838 RepID=A0AAV5GM05_9BASI|nr:hypothetical protein Rhopal_004547-T1 [Rhodotorula paludigena]